MPARVSPARRSGAHKSPKEREAGQTQQHLHETAQDGGQHGQGTEHGWFVPPPVRRSKSRVVAARRPRDGRRIPVGRLQNGVAPAVTDLRSGDQIIVPRRSWYARNSVAALSTAAFAVTALIQLINTLKSK